MRICLASNLYPPDIVGGAEVMVGHVARGLRRAGCDVTVIASAPRARTGVETLDGVAVHRIAGGNLYWAGDAARQPRALKPLWHVLDLWNVSVYRRLRRLLRDGKYDVIHTHNLGGLSPSVWSAASAAGTPIVHTPHDYALTCVFSTRMTRQGATCARPCGPCAARGRWLRRLSGHVNAVAAPSRFVLDRHRELGFFPNARTTVIPWGLPARPVPVRPAVSGSGVRFLYVGHLAPHKGVGVLLEAFARVDRTDVRLDIAGAGPLAAACAAAAAADRRIVFHGFVGGEDKDRLFHSGDVLVLPSTCWEVAGLVALEAFGYGMPVVGTRTGGIPETIDEGVTGFLVDPGDAVALTRRLELLAADRPVIRRLEGACRARAARITIDSTVAGLLEIYGGAGRG